MANGKLTIERLADKWSQFLTEKSDAQESTRYSVIISPPGCVLPSAFKDAMEKIQNFTVFPDDVWVVTYPRSGTTWSQEMIWLLRNNVDLEKAKSTSLMERFPFFELEYLWCEAWDGPPIPSMAMSEKLARPRCIKSHLPLELLPKQLWTVKPKIVYVTRDPRDVAISYYHRYGIWSGFRGTLDEFLDVFLNDRVNYSPYWSHILSFLDLEDKSHILFNTYEEMKQDLGKVIRKTASFLGVDVTDKQVEDMKEHLSFKSMRENKAVNCHESDAQGVKRLNADENDQNLKFIRKGECGEWKSTFGSEILEKFKKWNEHHLKDRNFKEYPWSV